MSSDKLDYLIAEFPQEEEAISRLSDLVFPVEPYKAVKVLPTARIFSLVRPHSFGAFVAIMDSLTSKKLIRRVIRVESESGGGIGPDYDSIVDIPEELDDFRTGRRVVVDFDNIKTYYEFK